MEGYLDSEIVFLVRSDAPRSRASRTSAARSSPSTRATSTTRWATERLEQYGWTVQRYGKNADAIQAVLSGRAFANIASGSASGWAAKQNPQLKTSIAVNTGRVFSTPFRLDDADTRNRIERVVECMKLDGFFSKLHEKWFAGPAAPGSSMVTVDPGFGAPGVNGYDATTHDPECG